MKRIIVAAALLLAACSKAPTPAQADTWNETYQAEIQHGYSPAEAKQMVEGAKGLQLTQADEKRAAAHQAEREKAEADIRASACKNDPGISYC